MSRRRSAALQFAALAIAPAMVAGQDPAAAAARLLRPAEAPRALAELRRAGPAGAVAVFDAFDAATRNPSADAAAAATLARALAELGTTTAAVTPRLLAAIRAHGEPLRSHLLRALATGAIVADAEAQAAIAAALPGMMDAGLFFSPAADAPTFGWYEYVRLRQRLSLAARDGEPGLMDALQQLAANRSGGLLFAGPFGGIAPSNHDLNAFGSHGQRELLEGAAERALAGSERGAEAVLELARYLEHEPPRPGIVLTESCAGIGEPAPEVPAAKLPTLWRRDDWRFACARAVFALHPEAEARQHALRHLLHCDEDAVRIEAIEAMRRWPPPWDALAADLAACLEASERAVVREALVTLGLAGAPVDAAMTAIERLASGTDAELAAMARRLLRDRASRRQR